MVPYVQDALDEIEYVTGDTNTTWGAQRAGTDIPRPSRSPMSKSATKTTSTAPAVTTAASPSSFDAIKAKYPGLQIIATTPVTKSRRRI